MEEKKRIVEKMRQIKQLLSHDSALAWLRQLWQDSPEAFFRFCSAATMKRVRRGCDRDATQKPLPQCRIKRCLTAEKWQNLLDSCTPPI